MIRVEESGCNTVVVIGGRLDGVTTPVAETVVMAALAPIRSTVIDLSDMDYISSVGLRLLMLIAKRVSQAGRRLAVCGLQPPVQTIFEISGFDGLMELRPTRADALAFIGA